MSRNESDIQWQSVLENIPVCREDQCGYYLERQSRTREFSLERDQHMDPALLAAVLAHGYRRCGTIYYRPCCDRCRDCLPYRIPLATFRESRNLRRVRHRNDDIEITFREPVGTVEKAEIYLRYQRDQHLDKTPTNRDRGWDPQRLLLSLSFQMYTNPESTRELEMHLPDKTLVAYGIFDVAAGAVSAVYLVFDPEYQRRSLGTFGILVGADWARELGAEYYYLGYYLPDHPEMDYKKRYGPAEIRDPRDGQWKPHTEDLVVEITAV